mgnify:CR=1 FL=1
MSILRLLPIEYQGRRLQEISERIVQVFNPKLDNFSILGSIRLEDLKSAGLYIPGFGFYIDGDSIPSVMIKGGIDSYTLLLDMEKEILY